MSPKHVIAAALLLMTAGYADAGQARTETADPGSSDQAVERAVPRAQPRGESRPAPSETRPAPNESRPAPQRAEPRQAIPRNQPAVRNEPAARTSRPTPPTRTAAAETAPPAPSNADGQEQAVPRGSRPQGDNPRIGTAVPRGEGRPQNPPVVSGGGGGTIIVNRGVYGYPYYSPYYYYPQRYYPYGYGGFGLGYFYYNPYSWYGAGGYGGYRNYGYHPGQLSNFYTGELRLRVTPRNAQVFVDGYYAGVVDDFDGTFQGLRLEEGPYRIEIVAPGYRTLEFDVRILEGRKITYRGDLERP